VEVAAVKAMVDGRHIITVQLLEAWQRERCAG
jgi:hypothetical protein